MWVITTGLTKEDMMYLGWQVPAWDEDGYFWTYFNVIQSILKIIHQTILFYLNQEMKPSSN